MIVLVAPPLLLAAILFASCWLWAGFQDRRPAVRLLAALTGTSALIVGLEVILGMAGALAPVPLASSAIGVAGLLGGGFLVAHSARRPRAESEGPAARPFVPSPLGLALGVLTALAYLWLLFVGALVPPYGWDTLSYHLTDVFQLAATRSLVPFPDPSHSFYYPKAGELHAAWFYLLSGAGESSWRVAGVALLPLALTAGVAVRVAGRALGLREAIPWLAPAVMLAPVVMIQPLAGYVDTAFAAFVLAAFAFGLLAAAEGRFGHLALCALASGLALGVKISFLYFGLPVLLVIAAPRAWRGIVESSPRRRLARLALLAVLFGWGGAYWYARNALATGNPLYPHEVRLLGVTLFHGPVETWKTAQELWFVPSKLHWLRYPFLETFFGKPAYTLENGFSPLFAAGFVATLLALAGVAPARNSLQFRALLALPLTVLLWLGVNPTPEPRYVIACCGFAFLALGMLADRIAAPGADGREASGPVAIFRGAVVAALLFSALGGAASAAPSLGPVLSRWKAGRWEPQSYYRIAYGAAGEAFNWLSREPASPKTVTYTNANFAAPLFGWHGRNRVVFARTDGRHDAWGVAAAGTYGAWRKLLRDRAVDWIVVWIPWWGERWPQQAETWIEEHPADFALAAEFGGRARIFRPVFREGERFDAEAPAPAPDLARLDDHGAWALEYATGTTLSKTEDPAGGVRLDYEFTTAGNDWADLRAGIRGRDWSRFASLSFYVEAPRQGTLLFVYLKGSDPRRWCRWRLDLGGPVEGARQATLELGKPEACKGDFTTADVAELHLVLDDADDSATGKGSLRVSGFRLDPVR
jgi:hypothetical protein